MITLSAEEIAARAAGTVVPRDFLYLRVRDRSTGVENPVALWSDLGTIDAEVIDYATGSTVSRTFKGTGAIASITNVAQVSGLVVQVITITLSHVNDEVLEAVQTYEVKRAPIELYRGFLDPVSHELVSPARPLFVGFVDENTFEIPPAGSEGAVTLTCASVVQDLKRANPVRRSDADQRLRSASDGFFRHVATVGNWKITWGQPEE